LWSSWNVADAMTKDPQALRAAADEAIAASHAPAARDALAALWRAGPNPASASFLVSRFEKLRSQLPLTSCKLAILRSFTVEPVIPLLRAQAFVGGIDLDVQLGDFNTYSQEILDPGSRLYAFEPDVVILAVQTSDIAPALWSGFTDLDAKGIDAAVEQTAGTFKQLIIAFRSRSKAQLLVHTLLIPPHPSAGVLDSQTPSSQAAAIGRINETLAEIARGHNNVYLLDYNNLIARRGFDNWFDWRKELTVGLPIAANEMIHLARQWARYLHPMTGKVCKVLAVDLDNTLWGGVIGEDGMDGIKLSGSYPGAAYRALQRVMLDLYHRGILLAVCSKNNPPEAMEAISKHPGMILRPEHFAALRINWQDKAANLRELAKELNLGIDSIAFIDDNPVEREFVRAQVPEVTIIDLPDDPMECARTLRDSPVFERLTVSEEDRSRGRYYAQDRMREELQQSAGSLEDFYRSLEMKVDIEPVTAANLARAAQLTQKTNQFNMTTRRYTEEQIAAMKPPQWRTYTIRVRDRFGDNGIVGLALAKAQGKDWEIDTLLLSCRVIGRTVETAFLATIAADARSAGASRLVGQFLPTKKNAPARDFYKQHQFNCVSDQNGAQTWELSLSNSPSVPAWIELHVKSG
jgi:FkbH-like protein